MSRRRSPEFYERPLTKEESDFASENIAVVWRYLNIRRLDPDEWFDVVVFRYLLSVKRWFADPALRQYKFTTIASKAMWSATGNEYAKRGRRAKTVSLFDPINGVEGLTYLDLLPAGDVVETEAVMLAEG